MRDFPPAVSVVEVQLQTPQRDVQQSDSLARFLTSIMKDGHMMPDQ